jgi:hypothetical protein
VINRLEEGGGRILTEPYLRHKKISAQGEWYSFLIAKMISMWKLEKQICVNNYAKFWLEYERSRCILISSPPFSEKDQARGPHQLETVVQCLNARSDSKLTSVYQSIGYLRLQTSHQTQQPQTAITQFSQQFRVDVNDRPSLTSFKSKPIKLFSVSRRVPGFLTAVADFATTRSRLFFLAPFSFCSLSQFSPQLRYNYDSRNISGIRAGLAQARWPVAFSSTPLLTPRFSIIFPNFAINDEGFSPVVISVALSRAFIVFQNNVIVVLVGRRGIWPRSFGR